MPCLKESCQRTLASNSPSHLYMHTSGLLGYSYLYWYSMPCLSLASMLPTSTLPFYLSQAPGVVQTTSHWGRVYNSQLQHVLHSKSKDKVCGECLRWEHSPGRDRSYLKRLPAYTRLKESQRKPKINRGDKKQG